MSLTPGRIRQRKMQIGKQSSFHIAAQTEKTDTRAVFRPCIRFLCLICIGLFTNSRYSAVNVQLAFVLVRVPAFMRVGSPLLNLEK